MLGWRGTSCCCVDMTKTVVVALNVVISTDMASDSPGSEEMRADRPIK